MTPTSNENMKENLAEAGSHLKAAAGAAGEAINGAGSAAGDELRLGRANVKAELADTLGNLTYRKAARNFSPLMAAAATKTVVQATKIVQPGEIDPEHVVTPGIFVDAIVEVSNPSQEEALMRAGVAYA